MKSGKLRVGLLLSILLVLTTAGFAAEKASLHTSNDMTVGGKPLPAGNYTVTWESNGPNVELNFIKGKNVVATVPAHIVNLNKATTTNSVVTRDNAGSRMLTQILFGGKKYALDLGSEVAQSGTDGEK